MLVAVTVVVDVATAAARVVIVEAGRRGRWHRDEAGRFRENCPIISIRSLAVGLRGRHLSQAFHFEVFSCLEERRQLTLKKEYISLRKNS